MENEAKSTPFNHALYGFMATALLLECERSGVFNSLTEQGRQTPEQLAQHLGLDPASLARCLKGAECWGLVKREEEKYSLDESVRSALSPDSKSYLGPLLNHFRENTIPLFSHLSSALIDGQPQWPKRGDSDTSPFAHLFATEESAANFHAAMWSISHAVSQELVGKGIVEGVGTLVDLGGGVGSLAIAAAQTDRKLQAWVFDLPEVEPHCQRYIRENGAEQQVQFLAGDYWNAFLPQADAYALGFILSDWDDENCIKLLRRVRQGVVPGGRVLILERLLDEYRAGPFVGVMQDLAMMLETGGMHRSAAHYRFLLEEAGFVNVFEMRSAGEKHAVIGFCPEIK